MNMTPWQRLHAIVTDRIDQLGTTRDTLHNQGGPSPAWIRGLKDREGPATVKQARSLLDLDAVMGWEPGTSRGLINDDRSDWSQAALDAEAFDLSHTNLPGSAATARLDKGEREIRHIQTMVGAALRAMPADRRKSAMADLVRILGI